MTEVISPVRPGRRHHDTRPASSTSIQRTDAAHRASSADGPPLSN